MRGEKQFSTEDVLPQERMSRWTRFFYEVMCTSGRQRSHWESLKLLHSNPNSPRDFRAQAEYVDVGALRICKVSAGPQYFGRDSKPTAEPVPPVRHQLIVVQTRGKSEFLHKGKSMTLAPGQWAVYDTRGPFATRNSAAIEQLLLLIPETEICVRGASNDALIAQPFCAKTGIGKAATELVRTAFSEAKVCSQRANQAIALTTTRLFREAIHDKEETATETTRNVALRIRVLSFIEDNLGNPDLSIDTIAQAFHCSKRNLHKAFAGSEDTINAYILRRRIECCRDEISDLQYGTPCYITEIAFKWGFNNPSHFSKSFKKQYGTSPRQYKLSCRKDRH